MQSLLSDTGQTLEEERARWVLGDTFLATSEWRNYDYIDMTDDNGEVLLIVMYCVLLCDLSDCPP